MKGDVKIGGETLRLTIGAMEAIAEESPAPAVILGALQSELYTISELRCVIGAGLAAVGSETDACELIDRIGVQKAKTGALALMLAFFEGREGKPDAAERKQEAIAS